jgi:heme-degrading monooxygenase HmoA
MYTRVVELTSKSGKARELCNTIDDKVLPILKRQAGFVDEAVMASDTESNRVLAVSFWHEREDAQRYEREQFDTVQKTVQHLLETAPVVRTFDVHTSTAHRVAADKAA